MKKEYWYKLQLITAWGAVGLVILDNILFYILEYSAGAANKPPAWPCCLFVIVWPGLSLLSLISVFMLLRLSVGGYLRKKQLVIATLSLVLMLIVCFLNFPLSKVRPAGAQIFLKGFEKWVINKVDVDKIQLWIKGADEKYWDEGITYNIRKGFPDAFPDCLKDFNLQYVWFERSEQDGSKIIRLEWGGGMFHWSLVIGAPNMKVPEQTIERFSDYDVEFRRILKPGVYVFSRG